MLLSGEILFYGPLRTAVRTHPAAGRGPKEQADDRLALVISLAALAANKAPDNRWPPLREAMVDLAKGINQAPPGPLPEDLVPLDQLGARGDLLVVDWQGEGRARVEVQVVKARAAIVPHLAATPDEAGPFREIAALALALAMAEEADAHERTRIALGLEGVVFWFRDSDRRAPPRNALAFALNHVEVRLEEKAGDVHPEF